MIHLLRTSIWLLLATLCFASPVAADELRPGYLELSQLKGEGDAKIKGEGEGASDKWQLTWKAPVRGGVTPQTAPILPKGCKLDGEPQRAIDTQAVVSRWQVSCTGSILGKQIGLKNFEASLTDVFVRIAPRDSPVQALRLTAIAPVVQIAAAPDRWQVAKSYFIIGIEHIIFGFDHLLFVLSLVLLLSGGWTIAKAVTAFTVAHSITLVGTTLGFVGLPSRPVEAVIALSIIFLAVEIARKQAGDPPRLSERLPWLVAFAFGLLHGFGFAGALSEIGLPEGEVPMALLTFNLGVEAGQLAIVAAALLVMALLRRLADRAVLPLVKLSSYVIGITASFWFIERTLG